MTAGGAAAGLLLGSDHPALGEMAVIEPAPGVAIALSAGRHRKAEPSVEPNEDAVMGAAAGRMKLAAVADGHFGFAAARAAVTSLYESAGALLESGPAADAGDVAARAFGIAAEAVALATADDPSRTALTVVVAAGEQVAAITAGDTAAVRVRRGRAKVLGRSNRFLGPDASKAAGPPVTAGLQPDDRIVVVSDGIYPYLGRRWPARIAELAGVDDPAASAAGLLEAAFAGGAGDHTAAAVLSIEVEES